MRMACVVLQVIAEFAHLPHWKELRLDLCSGLKGLFQSEAESEAEQREAKAAMSESEGQSKQIEMEGQRSEGESEYVFSDDYYLPPRPISKVPSLIPRSVWGSRACVCAYHKCMPSTFAQLAEHMACGHRHSLPCSDVCLRMCMCFILYTMCARVCACFCHVSADPSPHGE